MKGFKIEVIFTSGLWGRVTAKHHCTVSNEIQEKSILKKKLKREGEKGVILQAEVVSYHITNSASWLQGPGEQNN